MGDCNCANRTAPPPTPGVQSFPSQKLGTCGSCISGALVLALAGWGAYFLAVQTATSQVVSYGALAFAATNSALLTAHVVAAFTRRLTPRRP